MLELLQTILRTTAVTTAALFGLVGVSVVGAVLLPYDGAVAHFTPGTMTFTDVARRVALTRPFEHSHPVSWSADGARMAYRTVIPPAIKVQDVWTGDHITVQDASGDPLSVRLFALSPDGEQLAYSHERTIHVLDLATMHTQPVREFPYRMIRALDWSPDGETLAVSILDNESGDIALLDIATGGVTSLDQRHDIPKFAPSFSPDGCCVAYRGMMTSHTRVYVLNLETDTVHELPYKRNDGFVVAGIGWSPDGARLIYPVHNSPFDDNAARLETINMQTGEKRTLPASDIEGAPFWLP